MSVAATSPRPLTFAGFPVSAWFFGLRTWVAMMLALYVAFWLQLDGASSAATCVAILSLPTRGQVVQKALYRLVGTAAGVVASYVIAGFLNGTRDLFLVAVGAWLALCVYAAGRFDGFRAYGAVLSGYTVAIVAIPQIDAPQDTFSSGVNRGAAIVIGILALAVVNDVFSAPNILPKLVGKLADIQRKVRDFARAALRDGHADPGEVGALLREITALHPDLTTLPGESISGGIRAAGAARAVTALVREVSASRAVGSALAGLGDAGQRSRRDLESALDEECDDAPPALVPGASAPALAGAPGRRRLVAACASFVLRQQDRIASDGITAMRTGDGPSRGPRLPLYKSKRSAVRDALRIFIAFMLSSAVFVLSGWPETSTALLQLGALGGISATNPNPRGFAVGAVLAMPLAMATAGVTEFLVLDGVDAFPLLAIAMAPPVFAACLLMTAGRPLLYGIGFLLLVYVPVLLSPSNPQSYNPQTFLYSGVLSITSVVLLFVFLSILFPTDDARRRQWILRSAREELVDALRGRRQWYRPAAAAYRDADRIGQLDGLKDADHEVRDADLRRAIGFADLAAAARRFHAERRNKALARAASPAFGDGAKALEALDPEAMRRAAGALVGAVERSPADLRTAGARCGADLVWAAALVERNGADLGQVRQALA